MGSRNIRVNLSISQLQIAMIVTYYINIAICFLVFLTISEGMGGPGTWGKGKRCKIQFKFPRPCIDLKPPEDVQTAIQKCWKEAINIDFKCQKKEIFMKERFTKRERENQSHQLILSSCHHS